MNHAETIRVIREIWPSIIANARANGFRYSASQVPFPPVSPRLLGSSHKVELGEGLGVLTAVVYMSPAKESGFDMCPYRAGSGCEKSCIGTSTGMLSLPSSKRARLWKTALWLGNRKLWRELLCAEAKAHARTAKRKGLAPAIRVDGSTDTGEGQLMAKLVRNVHWYDYTKSYARAFASVYGTKRDMAPGQIGPYRSTLSFHGSNREQCESILKLGGNVAVVFSVAKGAPLPASWHGFPVIDGDESDVRFYDPPGTVVGLRFKRASRKNEFAAVGMRTGFVTLPVLT